MPLVRLIPALTLHYASPHTLSLLFLRLAREYGIGVGVCAKPEVDATQMGTLWLENIHAGLCHSRGRRLVQFMIRDLVAKFIFYDDLNLARHNRVFSLLWLKDDQGLFY